MAMENDTLKVTAFDVIEQMVAKYRERISFPGLLTVGEAGDVLGVSQATVKRWCNDELIVSFRTVGGHRQITAQALADFLNSDEYARRMQAVRANDKSKLRKVARSIDLEDES